MHILLSLLVATANAGWFQRFCDRHLVMDDPDQYSAVTDDWLARAVKPLEIRETWRTITPLEAHVLAMLRKEAERRARYPGFRVPATPQ